MSIKKKQKSSEKYQDQHKSMENGLSDHHKKSSSTQPQSRYNHRQNNYTLKEIKETYFMNKFKERKKSEPQNETWISQILAKIS